MLYWILRPIVLSILRLFFRFKVEGIENLPKRNNFIIVSNHLSFLDPLVICASMPQRIYCVASRYLFRISWLRWIFNKIGVLSTGSSSRKAVEYLTQNKIVAIFPEGGISRDGNLREFKRGAALLAYKTGRPIVPCVISGTYEALPLKAKFPRLRPITVKINGPVCLLKELEEIIDDVKLQEGILRIRNIMQGMLDAG
ncbi:MAG: lysophospholipid acyltransferase family protein [Candidatus Omnitrophota bacterium]